MSGGLTLSIIGHSPAQFIFLSILFPVAIISTMKMVSVTYNLKNEFPNMTDTKFWRWEFRRGIIALASIAIGITFATFDHYDTTPDFYHRTAEDAAHAAHLNKSIISSITSAESDEDRRAIVTSDGYDDRKRALQGIYKSESNLDPTMRAFEYVELTTVGVFVSLFFWMLLVNVQLNRFSQEREASGTRAKLRRKTLGIIPYGIVVACVYLFWAPLRSYNIFEISQVIEYRTIAPGFFYAFIALAAAIMAWIYYSKIEKKFLYTLSSVVAFFTSGALMGAAKLTPEKLFPWLGSGIRPFNLFVIVFFASICYVFGANIIQQIEVTVEKEANNRDSA